MIRSQMLFLLGGRGARLALALAILLAPVSAFAAGLVKQDIDTTDAMQTLPNYLFKMFLKIIIIRLIIFLKIKMYLFLKITIIIII